MFMFVRHLDRFLHAFKIQDLLCYLVYKLGSFNEVTYLSHNPLIYLVE